MKFLSLAFGALLLFAFGAKSQSTNNLSQAEIQGQQLAQMLCGTQPLENSTNNGTLVVRAAKNSTTGLECEIVTNSDGWESIYSVYLDEPVPASDDVLLFEKFSVIHGRDNACHCILKHIFASGTNNSKSLDSHSLMIPFAKSDFWLSDLSLIFFHWPDQKIIKYENRRTRACAVLESTNPNPAVGGYSRVDTWIDNDTLSIVHAEAYDTTGKLLKVFDPKSVKKVNGHYELQDMEIQNVQTHSRTWIKFDLSSGS